MDRVAVVVLASGTGTLFQALLDAALESDYPAEVAALVTDRPGSGAARRARAARLPSVAVEPDRFESRQLWDDAMTHAVAQFEPEWVVSLGFMRLLGSAFLERFPNRVINTHPSLLPSFPGATAVADAIAYGVKLTGCTVHLVDSGVDTGPVLAQRSVPIADDDTIDSLHDRIKGVERPLVVDVIAHLANDGFSLTGRKATIL